LRLFFLHADTLIFVRYKATTGLIVSGSTALSFFTRVAYGGDLDTYCQLSQAKIVGQWYESRGFIFAPTDKQDVLFHTDYERATFKAATTAANVITEVDDDIREYRLNNIESVWNFIRDKHRVQLIATRGSPLETILSFHSTCVMNILTHRAAYCLFPQLTLEEKTTLLIDLVSPLTEIQMAAVRKYALRGFTILHQAPTAMACNANSALTFLRPRRVGDKHCFKINFDHLGKGAPKPDYIEANTWGLAY
ncbi:uncharacterized protein C8R40DRAFT_1020350, partial [Lentinula edodes]|uniref:uncharacterized protein n=1 Tax=Lentinula edodes TaxID=5353 RepID=UPI001E8D0240